jgi:hypothetical protein
MLQMLYGYTPSPHTFDPLVAQVSKMMAQFSEATATGAWLVDVMPWLRYVPEWVPGTGFKQTAREWARTLDETMHTPVEFVKQQMARGSAKPSYISGLLGSPGRAVPPEEMDLILHSATALYGGGADTTVASLSYFFLAMTLSPEVQRKAREVSIF